MKREVHYNSQFADPVAHNVPGDTSQISTYEIPRIQIENTKAIVEDTPTSSPTLKSGLNIPDALHLALGKISPAY